ncbi:PH domain-containing protein [Paramicrobacterium humi]|uniref:PH domain-containing protein n=1 Tax=Paramicrobacterium humi TaxID=640635 RepID=A0A1H4T5B9_9MICO|nr:PH domain-containing protein [Microbacterium humi]
MDSASFVSRFNRILCVVCWALTAGAAAAVIWLAVIGMPIRLALLVPLGAIAAAAFVCLWRPGLTVDDDAITVNNVFATTHIPWHSLINVDTKYALTLFTPGRRIPVTAAPAPGSITAFRLARKEGKSRRDLVSSSRPGDLRGTDSGDAARLVRDRWESLKRAGRIELGRADEAMLERHPNRGTIVTLTAGVVLSVAALVLQ